VEKLSIRRVQFEVDERGERTESDRLKEEGERRRVQLLRSSQEDERWSWRDRKGEEGRQRIFELKWNLKARILLDQLCSLPLLFLQLVRLQSTLYTRSTTSTNH